MQEEAVAKPDLKTRVKKLYEEYGRVALVVYLTLHAGVYVISGHALYPQFAPLTGKSFLALLGAMWVASKVSQIPRTLAALALTPIVAKLWHRIRPPRPKDTGTQAP